MNLTTKDGVLSLMAAGHIVTIDASHINGGDPTNPAREIEVAMVLTKSGWCECSASATLAAFVPNDDHQHRALRSGRRSKRSDAVNRAYHLNSLGVDDHDLGELGFDIAPNTELTLEFDPAARSVKVRSQGVRNFRTRRMSSQMIPSRTGRYYRPEY